MNKVLKDDSSHSDKKCKQWHPAFFGAIHLELKENKEDLEFTEEKEVTLTFIREAKPIKVFKKLSHQNHIWLKSLSDNVNAEQAAVLLDRTQKLCSLDDKNHADSLWEIVTTANEDTIQALRRDKTMCQALAKIMKPEIDEAFNNGFNDGFDDCKKEIFKNMQRKGLSKELAQEYADINNELAEKILAEL